MYSGMVFYEIQNTRWWVIVNFPAKVVLRQIWGNFILIEIKSPSIVVSNHERDYQC